MTPRSVERQRPMKRERQPAPPKGMNYFGAQAPMFETSNLVSPSPSNQKKPTKAGRNNSEADDKRKKSSSDFSVRADFVPVSEEHLETRTAW